MHLVIKAVDEERRADLAGLARALREAGSMPGPVDVIDSGIQQGRLGPIPEAITVAVAAAGAGGSITVAVRELIRALLRQRSHLDVSVSLGHGREIQVVAHDLPRMSADELAALVEQIADSLRQVAGLDDAEPVREAPGTGARNGEAEPE